jgi:N-acetylglutamate synthase-like GNAT family acetyltransferase
MTRSGNIEDQTLTCVDCGNAFVWSTGEQEFFQEKGFTDPPKRCKDCRQARKDRRDNERDGRR